jgi:hypothetical protein
VTSFGLFLTPVFYVVLRSLATRTRGRTNASGAPALPSPSAAHVQPGAAD